MENEVLETKQEEETKVDNSNELEELKKQIAELKASNEEKDNKYSRLKKDFDKTASEYAQSKRDLRSKMSEEEANKAQREEEEQKKQLEFEELKNKLKRMESTKRFLEFGLDEKSSNECAEYELNGDLDKILKVIKGHNENLIKVKQAEWLNGRPDPVVGGNLTPEDAFLKGFNM